MIAPGDTIGGYEILSKLSAGGMATLFLATRTGASGFRKHVAVKVVHEHLAADPTFVQMFVDEALLSARIHHPNVVHIEELRQLDGQHFLVMEYISGVALSLLLRRLSRLGRRMTPALALHVAIQVADGLQAAHELKDEAEHLEGVVHRDVSPQNVLLAWEGHVKLIDFGVAKARSRIQQTTGASLKGKLRYMAPEQARGVEVDRRTDVYALGIVLWEMLTMKRRFSGPNDFAVLDLVRNPELIPPSRLNPEVSPELDAVVLRALAPTPEDRYATAQDLRRALAAVLPQALAVDASHLSELVRAACGGDLSKERKRLPSSMHLPSVIDVALDDEPEPLKTMTVSASLAFAYLDDSEAAPTPSSIEASFAPRPSTHTPLTQSTQIAGAKPWRIAALSGALLGLLVATGVSYLALREPSHSVSSPLPTTTSSSEPAGVVDPAAAPLAVALAPAPPDQAADDAGAAAAPEDIPAADPSTATTPPEPTTTTMRARSARHVTMTSRGMRPATMRRATMTSHGMRGMAAVPLADDFGF